MKNHSIASRIKVYNRQCETVIRFMLFFGCVPVISAVLMESASSGSLPASDDVKTKAFTDSPEVHFSPVLVDTSPKEGWWCHCLNSTTNYEGELECCCEGEALLRIPQKLHRGMQRLTIASAGLQTLRSTALKVYSSSLRDIQLTDLDEFERIQPGVFMGLENLRTIYISHAPKLNYLPKDAFLGISKTIKTIKIMYCGLVRIPDMSHLSSGIILHVVDFEGNRISEVESKSVNIKTEQLILDNNALATIENSAFYGSEIAKLSFKGNAELRVIHPSAFVGISNLQELDLSSTSLLDLPSNGLQDLEVLRVQNTHSLKTVPSIYNYKSLKVAYLTHSFHCCAFKFPSRHDPSRHAQRIQYLKNLQRACMELNRPTITSPSATINLRKKRRKRLVQPNIIKFDSSSSSEEHYASGYRSTGKQQAKKNQTNFNQRADSAYIDTITGSPVVLLEDDDSDEYSAVEISQNPDFGEFHDTTADVTQQNNLLDGMCGNLTQEKIRVSCFPIPDELNPCEDVMGSYWLRASVWVVVLLAVFGNMAVLVVLLSNRSDGSVPKFLMSNLAFADLCMGLYLLLLASIDAHSMGEYFNYAFDWQYGTGCKIAGFLTVFASHLSVFTLTIITLERWFAITHAIYLNKRINLKSATYIMATGWLYSTFMSAFPLFGISNYSSTSICLPMEARDSLDVIYLVSILGVNGVAFFIIAICYAQIYFSLGKETRRAASTGEMTVAKKMALLVFTNFSCWAPIAFFGLTALAGYPLINVTKSKILLVFFYPLNSCADPYLYAILTSQYRRDLYLLLSRFGVCKQKAQQYKSNYSYPVTAMTCPMPLVPQNSCPSGQGQMNRITQNGKSEEHRKLSEEFV